MGHALKKCKKRQLLVSACNGKKISLTLSTEKTPALHFLFKKVVATSSKKRLPFKCFSVNFDKSFKTTFTTDWAASEFTKRIKKKKILP